MATAADRRRWDDLHASYADASAAARDYESQLSLKYGGARDRTWRSWTTRTERARLERLEARADRVGDKIVDLIVRISPRGEAWLSGAPAWWIRDRLTWEDAIRPADEPMSAVVPAPYGATRWLREVHPEPDDQHYVRFQPRGMSIFEHTSDASETPLPEGYVFAYDDISEVFGDWTPYGPGWEQESDQYEVITFIGKDAYDPGDWEGVAVVPIREIRRESMLGWLKRQARTSDDEDIRHAAAELLRDRRKTTVHDDGPAVTDWQRTLVPGDARYVPDTVRPQMPDIVARALAAGAPAPLEYVGAGMTGAVFCTGDVAYKVARDTRPIDHQFFEDEADWLAAASQVPEVAPHVARFHHFDPDNIVIVRDCPRADPDQSAWRYGEGRLYDLHRRIERAMIPHGWIAPEFKPDSYVLTVGGPVLVDASMPSRVGEELARYVEDVVAGDREMWTTRPSDLVFYVRSESGRTIHEGEADRLVELIARRWPESGQES